MRRVAADIARFCRFDLRRHRGLAAVVVALEACRALIAESVLRLPVLPSGLREADIPGSLGQVGVGAADAGLWLLALVTTAMVVQADHPSDDRAFWRTRPIAPGTLATAKIAILAALLVVVPVAINTLRLVLYGAPLVAIGAAAIQIAVLAGFAVVPAWPLALVTRTVPRFLALALVVTVAVFMAYANLADHPIESYSVHDRFRFGLPMPVFDWRRHDLHGWWTGLAFVLSGLGMIGGHYATRRIAVSLPLGIVLVFGLAVWPIRPAAATDAPAAIARTIEGRLSLPGGVALPDRSSVDYWRSEGGNARIWGGFAVPALPPDLAFAVRLGPGRITTARGVVRTSGGRQRFRGHSPQAAIDGVTSMLYYDSPTYVKGYVTGVAPDDVAQLDGPAVDLDADAVVDLTRHHVVGSIPLTPGAAFRTDRYLLEIVGSWPGSAVVVRLSRFPTLGPPDEPRLWLFSSDAEGGGLSMVYWDGWFTDGDFLDGFERPGWANGRDWSDRIAFGLFRKRNGKSLSRLLIVEARDAGQVRTHVSLRDVPVRRRP